MITNNNIRLILGKRKENETFESKPESTEKYRNKLQRIPDLFSVERNRNAFTLTECLKIQGPMRVETFFLIRADLPPR